MSGGLNKYKLMQMVNISRKEKNKIKKWYYFIFFSYKTVTITTIKMELLKQEDENVEKKGYIW